MVKKGGGLEDATRIWPSNPWTGKLMGPGTARGTYTYTLRNSGTAYTLTMHLSSGRYAFSGTLPSWLKTERNTASVQNLLLLQRYVEAYAAAHAGTYPAPAEVTAATLARATCGPPIRGTGATMAAGDTRGCYSYTGGGASDALKVMTTTGWSTPFTPLLLVQLTTTPGQPHRKATGTPPVVHPRGRASAEWRPEDRSDQTPATAAARGGPASSARPSSPRRSWLSCCCRWRLPRRRWPPTTKGRRRRSAPAASPQRRSRPATSLYRPMPRRTHVQADQTMSATQLPLFSAPWVGDWTHGIQVVNWLRYRTPPRRVVLSPRRLGLTGVDHQRGVRAGRSSSRRSPARPPRRGSSPPSVRASRRIAGSSPRCPSSAAWSSSTSVYPAFLRRTSRRRCHARP